MNKSYYAAAIKYERSFKPDELSKYKQKITVGTEYINASVSWFTSSESIEELFNCENRFLWDAMQNVVGKGFDEYFEQW